MEGSALKKVEASDPNYMRTLETSIRVGEPVLLEVSFVLWFLVIPSNVLAILHMLYPVGFETLHGQDGANVITFV